MEMSINPNLMTQRKLAGRTSRCREVKCWNALVDSLLFTMQELLGRNRSDEDSANISTTHLFKESY
jgi:hypothetical protein